MFFTGQEAAEREKPSPPNSESKGSAPAAPPSAKEKTPSQNTEKPFSGPPQAMGQVYPLPLKLRYGENPHQTAKAYQLALGGSPLFPWRFKVLKGDALSYNNALDVNCGLSLVGMFQMPAVVVTKHAIPCGVAMAPTTIQALELALASDVTARYGCGLSLNRPVGLEIVPAIKGVFIDVIAGPGFADDLVERWKDKRPKLKAVECNPPSPTEVRYEARSAMGILFVQEANLRRLKREDLKLVTDPQNAAHPDELEITTQIWDVVKAVRSNGIVMAKGGKDLFYTVGIGSGQTARVRAVKNAASIAKERGAGAVLASDAYFPEADGIQAAADAGIKIIIQPGGSVKDPEVINTANENGLAMYFHGQRGFSH